MPISIFGMLKLTRVITNSHLFTVLSNLGSCCVMLAASPYLRRLGFTLLGSESIVGMASGITVANHDCIPRLLPEERQVLSYTHADTSISVCKTITHTTSRRTSPYFQA